MGGLSKEAMRMREQVHFSIKFREYLTITDSSKKKVEREGKFYTSKFLQMAKVW